MLDRLQVAMDAGTPVTGADAVFYTHEASEATMMARGMTYDEAHAAALFDALRLARMRVDERHLHEVARILGTDRLSQCPSLPRHLRPIVQSARRGER